jgi:ribosomal protein S27E
MKKKETKTMLKCPDCGSGCIWYKPDGTVLCAVCMALMDKSGNIIKSGRKAGKV